MTDVMPPQAPQPQVAAKPVQAASRSPEVAQESEPNQGFSDVLKTRMQSGKGSESQTKEKPAPAEAVVGAGREAEAVVADDGKVLPVSGSPETDVIAALTAETVLQSAPAPAVEAADDTNEIGITIPDQVAVIPPVTVAAVTPRTEVQVDADPVAAASARSGPWVTGAGTTSLPEPAQSAVAQAVREAIVDRDAVASTQSTQQIQERFGAEVRAFVAAQQRPAGFEALLDRAVPTVQQSPPSTALPQGLQGVLPQDATAATARPALPTTTLDTPFRQPGWDQALSERVVWAANQKLQSAEIKLNPPQLGPIEVRVQMHQDQAQVNFTAQHAAVRDALEAAMPRLREMFSANGFNLVDVNVSQHSFAEQQRQAQGFGSPFRGGREGGDDAMVGVAAQQEHSRAGGLTRSGIDLFA